MCGIAGIVNFRSAAAAVDRTAQMRGALRHRGPDGEGLWSCGEAMLAHTRLAVIGVADGRQPILNEDGSAVLVCNGEIYNYRELAAELSARGHRFSGGSDSEVILHLYEEYPEDFPGYLQGMFAFAIYDLKKRVLLLGRDRLGEKPLFFEQSGAELSFASELGALHPGRSSLDMTAVHSFFSLQYIPPPETVFRGVRQLLPAHLLYFDLEKRELRCRRYWRPDFAEKRDISLDEAAGELRRLLARAVERRLMAEVPLGGFLSGGMDSAIVAALMLEKARRPISFISIGFEDAAYDESAKIVRTAAFLKKRYPGLVDSRILPVQLDSLGALRKVAAFFGQPFADASMLPTFELSRMTREMGLTVTLSGDGADELFGGYERYQALEFAGRFRRLAPLAGWWSRRGPDGGERTFAGRLRRFASVLALEDNRRYWQLVSRGGSGTLFRAYGGRMRDTLPGDPAWILQRCLPLLGSSHPVERAAELDLLTYLPGDVLTKVDIASMRSAQEVRSPFLDGDVVDFAASLPWRFKQRGRARKILLKKAFGDLLPPETVNGAKRGFGVPVASLLRSTWRREARELTIGGEAVKGDFFTASGVEELWRRHLSGRSDESRHLFSLLIFELFLRS